MKKRGFGVGKWNGFGGKVEPGEAVSVRHDLRQWSSRDCAGVTQRPSNGCLFEIVHVTVFDQDAAIRELQEEAGITPTDLQKRGILLFQFVGEPVPMEVHVFRATACTELCSCSSFRMHAIRARCVPASTQLWSVLHVTLIVQFMVR